MTESVAAAKDEVQRVIGDLEAIRERLVRVAERLPAGSPENDPEEDLEEADEVTELRSVIQCALQDSLRPLIDDLQAVAGLKAE